MRLSIFLLPLFCVEALQKFPKYPYDPRIHNFGNTGLGGRFHAFLARPITKIIDNLAYDGVNIRYKIIKELDLDCDIISDWCCGVGTSSEALKKHYKSSKITSYDTSQEMIDVAKLYVDGVSFDVDDAEEITLKDNADLITIMFAFHEIPQEGRLKILENARSNLKEGGKLLIVDIDLTYKPSYYMRSGEPFIDDYMENVESDIEKIFLSFDSTIHIEGHVRSWLMSK